MCSPGARALTARRPVNVSYLSCIYEKSPEVPPMGSPALLGWCDWTGRVDAVLSLHLVVNCLSNQGRDFSKCGRGSGL